jgi:radical SAM protein with 4Fe4S-binding SPASM domain
MVSYASGKNIYTATSTNAHFLDDDTARQTVESGLDRIIISIDGTTQETYEAYRKGGELKKVLDGTKELIKWKKELKSSTPYVIFQFLAVKPNQHQIEDIQTLGKQYGVDEVKIKTAQIYNYENGNPLIPTISKYSRYYLNDNGKYRLKNGLANHCWKLWHSTVITWDGSLVPCCFDKDAKHSMGNLNNSSFGEIWYSDKYRQFRSAVLGARKNIDICTNCSEGTKVWSN